MRLLPYWLTLLATRLGTASLTDFDPKRVRPKKGQPLTFVVAFRWDAVELEAWRGSLESSLRERAITF